MLNRRQFVWGTGGTMLVGAGAFGSSLWRKPGQAVLLDRHEEWATSICQHCPSGCGLSVRLANGSPVTVRGNPLHPVNRGGLCARGGASLQAYYDPDRFAGPVKRAPDLIGGWAPTAWDDALKEVGARLQAANLAGPGRVAAIRGDGRDIGGQLLARLVRASGSDWIVDAGAASADVTKRAIGQMHGIGLSPVYDLARSSFVMSFDSGLLDAAPDAMNLHRSFAKLRDGGGRFVHAGPRMGVTGSKADTWLPILPTTAGILALGVAHIILKEGLADDEFLKRHASRFDDWTNETGVRQQGIRTWILRQFSPQRVADLTGIGWDQIIRTARQFGSSSRPLAIGPVGTSSGYSQFDLMAVHTLNAIVGAIDVPGGVLFGRPPPFDRLEALGEPRLSGRSVEELTDWIASGRKPSVDVLFIHDADPIFTSPAGDRLAKALEKVPLVVSTSPAPNDSAAMANIVLPDKLWLERRCDAVGFDANGFPVVSTSPAAVRPRADGRSTADVVLNLAKVAGASVAEKFPWSSHEALIDERHEAVFGAGAGDVFADMHHSTWAQLLERGGWRIPTYRNKGELKERIDTRGGWWDPVYYHGEWRRVFPGSRQRIDLLPVQAAAGPTTLQRPERPAQGELYLHVYSELNLDTPLAGSMPYLQDLGSPLSERGWGAIAEINPVTAAAREISQGDPIKLTSVGGAITAVASLTHAIRPDVVAVNAGTGRVVGGRYAAGIGASPLRLMVAAPSGGARPDRPVLPTTTVTVTRA